MNGRPFVFGIGAGLFLWIAPNLTYAASVCELAPDQKSLSVSVTNPSNEPINCTITCKFALDTGDKDSIDCSGEVSAEADKLVLCRILRPDVVVGSVEPTTENCIKPAGTSK